jgi:hypothetical protein
MVFLDHGGHYGILMPFWRMFIWYLVTIKILMVLFCHLGGYPYGISSL